MEVTVTINGMIFKGKWLHPEENPLMQMLLNKDTDFFIRRELAFDQKPIKADIMYDFEGEGDLLWWNIAFGTHKIPCTEFTSQSPLINMLMCMTDRNLSTPLYCKVGYCNDDMRKKIFNMYTTKYGLEVGNYIYKDSGLFKVTM